MVFLRLLVEAAYRACEGSNRRDSWAECSSWSLHPGCTGNLARELCFEHVETKIEIN